MKEMKPVQVDVVDGRVNLIQLDPLGNHDATIVLNPEQVPLVIKWMREAARDVQQEGALSEH